MPKPEPIPERVREQVLALAREGVPRNEIARRTGVSPTSVSRIARRAGVTFERAEQTELATAVRAADQRAKRVEVAAGLLDDLAAGRSLLAAAETPRQWLDYAKGLQSLAVAHARLAEVEHKTKPQDDGAAESRSMLGDLFTVLRAEYGDRYGHGPDDDQEGATP